jgi:surface protein
MLGNIIVQGKYSIDRVVDYHKPQSKRELEMVVRVAVGLLGVEADLNWIDTSAVNSMASLFRDTYSDGDLCCYINEEGKAVHMKVQLKKFCGDISRWNTSNVESMAYMFAGNRAFNGDLNNWDVSNVKTFQCMFLNTSYNNDLNNWDVAGAHFNPIWGNRPDGRYKYMNCFDGMFNGNIFMEGKNVEKWGERLDVGYTKAPKMFTERYDRATYKMTNDHFPSWYQAK